MKPILRLRACLGNLIPRAGIHPVDGCMHAFESTHLQPYSHSHGIIHNPLLPFPFHLFSFNLGYFDAHLPTYRPTNRTNLPD